MLGGSYDFDNDGFRWGTENNEITFGIRRCSSSTRIYANSNQEFASSGIFNPRTRFYFAGNLTRPIAYEFSFQETYSTVNLLDSYLNYRFSDGLQIRLGRYKTPFTYEFYRVHVWHLLVPERSLFATNFEGNRRFGFMGWGSLFDKRLEYAVGTFDRQRNSYVAFTSHQDIMAFLNIKPFEPWSDSFLQNLQFGGSVDAGIENNPLTPAVLTTSAPPSPSTLSTGAAPVPFLAFNNGVMECGYRALWELHLAYYYGGLSLLGAWDSGFQDYAIGRSGPPPIRVPTSGYFVQAGYILTGETIRDRTLIDPLSRFDLRPGHCGLGASRSRPHTAICRWAGRSSPAAWPTEPPDQPCPDGGCRLKLVSQQIRQGVLRLGAPIFASPESSRDGSIPEVQRPVLAGFQVLF